MIEHNKKIHDPYNLPVVSARKSDWRFLDRDDRPALPFLNALSEHPDIITRWTSSGNSSESYVGVSFRGDALAHLVEFSGDILTELATQGYSVFSNMCVDMEFKLLNLPSESPNPGGWLAAGMYFRGAGQQEFDSRVEFYRMLSVRFRSYFPKWGIAPVVL